MRFHSEKYSVCSRITCTVIGNSAYVFSKSSNHERILALLANTKLLTFAVKRRAATNKK